MHRRDLLKAAATLPLLNAARLFAAPPANTRLLVVFMRGGYDAANVVVPVASDFYYEARPTIAIPRGDVLPLADGFGLHPILKGSLYPLWAKRQLAFVPFAGTSDLSRSHFETQASIERGGSAAGSGFMGRLVAQLTGTTPIAFTSELPLILRGAAVPNIAPDALGGGGGDTRQAALIARMYAKDTLGSAVRQGFGARIAVSEALATEMATAGQGAIPAQGFEAAARKIGRVMRDKYTLGFVDVGGWDTHVEQGGVGGPLSFVLDVLGKSLAGFADEIGPAWANTVVVVISEFGRTIRENGGRGTDHGHGTAYWLMGGKVAGGKLHGEQVRLTRATLNQDRDLPMLNDYRQVLGGLFQRLYGLTPAQVETVFPGAKPVDLGLI